jgi:hypothetical protein
MVTRDLACCSSDPDSAYNWIRAATDADSLTDVGGKATLDAKLRKELLRLIEVQQHGVLRRQIEAKQRALDDEAKATKTASRMLRGRELLRNILTRY